MYGVFREVRIINCKSLKRIQYLYILRPQLPVHSDPVFGHMHALTENTFQPMLKVNPKK